MLEFYQYLQDPKKLISAGGLLVVLLVVFAENGIFFGFFLPGDTLLFTAGLLCAAGTFKVSIWVLTSTIVISAFLGSLFGYYFGIKTSDTLHLREDSIFFKKKYLAAAEAFFTKHGGLALILGRFLPIIRTFAPIFAGIIKFNLKEYLIYNAIGAIAWGVGMTMLGFTLGSIYPDTEKHLDKIIIGIIIVTWIPVVVTYVKDVQRKKKEAAEKEKELSNN
ncbi:MAG: DedA family protein [Cytophagaceae bacterium]|jgi:membrane-associated protein|nr:DedA family protein [Cytophagaceae bacterium]